MNIYQVSEKFKISMKKLRQMRKAGVLLIDETEHPLREQMRYFLSKSRLLSVEHLLALIDNPRLALQLGTYVTKARSQVNALGDLRVNTAPPYVANKIYVASTCNDDAIDILIAWLKDIIPASPVTHHYVAVRLVLGVDPLFRVQRARRIKWVLDQCRKRPEFADWWTVEKGVSGTRTFYRRPKKMYDL